jgi:hypothetical protein
MTTTTITTTHTLLKPAPLSRIETPEEKALALFNKLKQCQGLSQAMNDEIAQLAEEFQQQDEKSLILAKLYWHVLKPLTQEFSNFTDSEKVRNRDSRKLFAKRDRSD